MIYQQRQQRVAQRWVQLLTQHQRSRVETPNASQDRTQDTAQTNSVVLIYSGAPLPVAGTDLTHPFFPHPDFVHLTGYGTPRLVLAFYLSGQSGGTETVGSGEDERNAAGTGEASEGTWQLFGYRPTADEMVWEQPPEPLGLPLSEIAGWLSERGVKPAGAPDASGTSTGASGTSTGASGTSTGASGTSTGASGTNDSTSGTDAGATQVVLIGAPMDDALADALPTPLVEELAAAPTTPALVPAADPTAALTSQLTTDLTTDLTDAIAHDRLYKDAAAIADLRAANDCSLAGFNWVFENVTAGITERSVQIGMEAEFYRAGAARVAYDSIVAAGPNSAFLHYVPSASDALRPATATINPGDLLLIDAGAQIGGYASDVTRTMVVGADPTDEQSFLWNLVLQTQEQAIDRCRPGVEWRDVHMAAATQIGAGLVEFGLLRGEPNELVAAGAVALFFPHGLGHLIGLAVHDAGGYLSGHERSSADRDNAERSGNDHNGTDLSQHPQTRYLRTDRTLEPGMVTSVEPGVYFIEALLGEPQVRERFANEVIWERADELRGFGGIRIEDDVLICAGEPEVLTAAIPKPLRVG